MRILLSPAAVLFLLLLLAQLVKKTDSRTKYMSLVIFTASNELFLGIGGLFKIGTYEINYSYIATIVTLLYGVIHFGKRLKSKDVNMLLVFWGIIIAGMIWRMISPGAIYSTDHTMVADDLFNGSKTLIKMEVTLYSWITLFRTLMFSIILMIFKNVYSEFSFNKVISKMIPFCKGYIIFGLVEFVINNIINPVLVRNIIIFLFGAGENSAAIPYYRAHLYTVLLTCREPSLAMYALLFCILMLLWKNNPKKKRINTVLVLIGTGIMVISLTITGLLYTGILILFWLSKHDKRKVQKFAGIVVVVLLGGIAFVVGTNNGIKEYFLTRLQNALSLIRYVFDNLGSSSVFTAFGAGSEVVRAYSMLNNLGVFIASPLLGCGLGTATCFSGWITVLSNIGLLGVISYIGIQKRVLKKTCSKDYITSAIVFGVAFTLQGGIADILESMFYIIWVILGDRILQSYRTQKMKKGIVYEDLLCSSAL